MGSLSVNTDGSASLRTTLMGVPDVSTAEEHEAAARPTRCGMGRLCAEHRRVTAGLGSPQVPTLLGRRHGTGVSRTKG